MVSGKVFNALYADAEFYKFTNEDEVHHGLQYVTGLNTIKPDETFNPSYRCSPGGLYFCSKQQLKFVTCYKVHAKFIRKVTIPDDAQVYCEENKFKCDKLVLGERQEFWFDDYFDDQEVDDEILSFEGDLNFRYVRDKTSERCMRAILDDPHNLGYVPDDKKTLELCRVAYKGCSCTTEHMHPDIAALPEFGGSTSE